MSCACLSFFWNIILKLDIVKASVSIMFQPSTVLHKWFICFQHVIKLCFDRRLDSKEMHL